MLFHDRSDAGRRLAARMQSLRGADVVVLGVPRGGVPVAFEVAAALGAPLDVILVRSVSPTNPNSRSVPSAKTVPESSTTPSCSTRSSLTPRWLRWNSRSGQNSPARRPGTGVRVHEFRWRAAP
ncbi:phosphoribosyl transferase-like protein [Nocardia pseudobrasiliensis]|uniref:Phosphoribosyl transferase-like protein n=1 Tax=Nocardia pseudobrasiliensis TaxID=45979 RepID=A0A370HPD1_9NOCA|nr:phosphoribosyl transferase-like protein [Nocardia pseudobrasiliensis]